MAFYIAGAALNASHITSGTLGTSVQDNITRLGSLTTNVETTGDVKTAADKNFYQGSTKNLILVKRQYTKTGDPGSGSTNNTSYSSIGSFDYTPVRTGNFVHLFINIGCWWVGTGGTGDVYTEFYVGTSGAGSTNVGQIHRNDRVAGNFSGNAYNMCHMNNIEEMGFTAASTGTHTLTIFAKSGSMGNSPWDWWHTGSYHPLIWTEYAA